MRTVLVIDDDGAIGELIGAVLELGGYRVHYAPSGPEGLALAREIHPGLILLDLRMPHMTGIDVLRVLESDPCLARIPVIAMSAGRTLTARIAGFPLAAFLEKPFDLAVLEDLVDRYCRAAV